MQFLLPHIRTLIGGGDEILSDPALRATGQGIPVPVWAQVCVVALLPVVLRVRIWSQTQPGVQDLGATYWRVTWGQRCFLTEREPPVHSPQIPGWLWAPREARLSFAIAFASLEGATEAELTSVSV